MATIVQVEFSESLVQTRKEILVQQGHTVESLIGLEQASAFRPKDSGIDLVVIGHTAHWNERARLISYFKQVLPGVPLIALLRMGDRSFSGIYLNVRADDPAGWKPPAATPAVAQEFISEASEWRYNGHR